MSVQYVTCTCTELGCQSKAYRLGGVTHVGKRMCAATFQAHQEEIIRLRQSTNSSSAHVIQSESQISNAAELPRATASNTHSACSPHIDQARVSGPCEGISHVFHETVVKAHVPFTQQQRKSQAPDAAEPPRATASNIPCSGSPNIDEVSSKTKVDTSRWSPTLFKYLDPYVLIVTLQAVAAFLFNQTSHKDINNFLKIEKAKAQITASSSDCCERIPSTIDTALGRIGLAPEVIRSVCCPGCFALYPMPEKPKEEKKRPAKSRASQSRTAQSCTDAPPNKTPRPASTILAPAAGLLAKNSTPVNPHLGEDSTTIILPASTSPTAPPETCTSPVYFPGKRFLKMEEIPLCSTKLFNNGPKQEPFRVFAHQSLKDWLGRMLCGSQFEHLIDSHLARPPWRPENEMHDVWDGSVWNTLRHPSHPDLPYTQVSGNLVFSLFVDWFNPYHGKKKHVSLGTIALVCLNLPPWDRYQEQNIFLYGIIPGPKEPSLDQINHILEPLVHELQQFYDGVWFNQTFKARTGRLIKAVIFPLIADLPALRKTAGHSSHSSKHFCSFCTLLLEQIKCIDPTEFPPRIDKDHLSIALKWLAARTLTERDEIFEEHGVRYSALNALPYWCPIEYCSIDLMHCILLGNVKDFCLNYLDVSKAGKLLRNEEDRRRRWLLRPSVDEVFCKLSSQNLEPGEKKRSRDQETDPQPSASDCNTKSSKKARRPTNPLPNLGTATSQPSQRRPKIIKQNTESPYNLRSRKRVVPSISRPDRPEVEAHIPETEEPMDLDTILPSRSPSPSRSHQASSSSRLSSTNETVSSKSNVSNQHTSNSNRPCAQASIEGSSHRSTSASLELSTAASTSNFSQAPTPSSQDLGSCSDTSTEKGFRGRRTPLETTSKSSKPSARKSLPQKNSADQTKKEKASGSPRLLFEELEAIHVAIRQISLPSTVTRVPKEFGVSGNKSLKAAEWLVIICVYFPLVLVPLWTFGTNNPNRHILLNVTTSLVGITNMLSMRSISNDQIQQLSDMMRDYRKLLLEHWLDDELTPKPNIHIAQHYPEVIRRFGPPASTASWAQERLNGILGKISTNNHLSDLPLTIFSKWNLKAKFLALLRENRENTSINERMPSGITDLLLPNKSNSNVSTQKGLPEEYHIKWLQRFPEYNTFEGTSAPSVSRQFLSFRSTELYKKRYSNRVKHVGDSTIYFKHKSGYLVGQIEQIFSPSDAEDRKFFAVLPFEQLTDSLLKEKDPYRSFPHLNASLLCMNKGGAIILDETEILGHAVILKNPPGTFGIVGATCCAVRLNQVMSHMN